MRHILLFLILMQRVFDDITVFYVMLVLEYRDLILDNDVKVKQKMGASQCLRRVRRRVERRVERRDDIVACTPNAYTLC
jgi:hypothetical protein